MKFISLALAMFSLNANALEKKDLIGTWKLQSYILTEEGKEWPWCAKPFGLISYFSNGYMAVGINCHQSEEDKTVTSNNKDMVFYTGRFSLRKPNTVLHHVENSNDISRIGKSLEREASIVNDQITLTGVGVKGPVRLVWKKTK